MRDCLCNRFSRDAIIAHFSRQNGRSKPLGPGKVRAYKVADPGILGNVYHGLLATDLSFGLRR